MAYGPWSMAEWHRPDSEFRSPSAINHMPSTMSHIKVAPYVLGHPHHLHHLGDRVHADDVRTGEDGGRHGRSRSPIPIRRGPAADRIPQKRLARRADEHGAVECRRELRESCQHTITVR